jgi:SagB-type dehydrogenase family enzyme
VVDSGSADPGTDRWWAVDPLILLPGAGRVRLCSPRVDGRLVVVPEVAQILISAQSGIAKSTLTPPFDWTPARYLGVTERLAARGFLVDGSDQADLSSPWSEWGPLAWAYHDSISRPEVPARANRPGARAAPDVVAPASAFRTFDTDLILLLPRLSPRSSKGFVEVLEQRRTYGEFSGEQITSEELSDILRYTFGPLRFADAGPHGVVQLRAAASGGARHETDAYVYVFNVRGVEAGIYAYDALRHGLVPVRPGLHRTEAEDLTLNQGFFCKAAIGVVTVARSDRLASKYRNPSAYRLLWQNVGTMTQVFSLVCASLDLGASLTGAIRIPEARSALAITSPGELVTFAMACGRLPLDADGQPRMPALPQQQPFAP